MSSGGRLLVGVESYGEQTGHTDKDAAGATRRLSVQRSDLVFDGLESQGLDRTSIL